MMSEIICSCIIVVIFWEVIKFVIEVVIDHSFFMFFFVGRSAVSCVFEVISEVNVLLIREESVLNGMFLHSFCQEHINRRALF